MPSAYWLRSCIAMRDVGTFDWQDLGRPMSRLLTEVCGGSPRVERVERATARIRD